MSNKQSRVEGEGKKRRAPEKGNTSASVDEPIINNNKPNII